MLKQCIKFILHLPDFFHLLAPSSDEPNVFPVEIPSPSFIPCPYCQGRTVCHGRRKRRVRHSYAWHLGVLWLELQVPRQVCLHCEATFMHDFGLGLSGTSTEHFRREIVQRCHGRSLSSVAREYGIAYTTLERWFYQYAPDELVEEESTVVCVDEFATQKGQQYATSVLNAHTGRILAIVPNRNEEAITTVVSDFAPAMAKAMRTVFPQATHILDRFHLVQFFTEAILRRRRYLGDSKKHIHVRIIDRCLSVVPTKLTEEERSIVRRCTMADKTMGVIYHALQHIRYVFKATHRAQAQRRLHDWLSRFQFHSCGVLAKIAKTLKSRETAILDTILSAPPS